MNLATTGQATSSQVNAVALAGFVAAGAWFLSNTWDAGAGRYRGGDGTFRSGRFG